jgi:hypothetical protein
MIVRCLSKYGKDLPVDALVPKDGFGPDQQFDLIPGKYYVVYGMTLYSSYIWYYICEGNPILYPFWNPSPLFEVIDGRLSKYWMYSFTKLERLNKFQAIWAYRQWAEEPYYYDLLTDGEEREFQLFKAYKELMDLEFPDPSIQDRASSLDSEWLMCNFCIDAWQTQSIDGMVICPTCHRMLHNPHYRDRLESLTHKLKED